MPQEFQFIQDIVQAAYELGVQRGEKTTIDYLEKLLDQYGIDRPSIQQGLSGVNDSS